MCWPALQALLFGCQKCPLCPQPMQEGQQKEGSSFTLSFLAADKTSSFCLRLQEVCSLLEALGTLLPWDGAWWPRCSQRAWQKRMLQDQICCRLGIWAQLSFPGSPWCDKTFILFWAQGTVSWLPNAWSPTPSGTALTGDLSAALARPISGWNSWLLHLWSDFSGCETAENLPCTLCLGIPAQEGMLFGCAMRAGQDTELSAGILASLAPGLCCMVMEGRTSMALEPWAWCLCRGVACFLWVSISCHHRELLALLAWLQAGPRRPWERPWESPALDTSKAPDSSACQWLGKTLLSFVQCLLISSGLALYYVPDKVHSCWCSPCLVSVITKFDQDFGTGEDTVLPVHSKGAQPSHCALPQADISVFQTFLRFLSTILTYVKWKRRKHPHLLYRALYLDVKEKQM